MNNSYFCSVAENLNNSYFCSVAENLNNSYFCSLAENLNDSYFCSVAENLNNSYFCSLAENLNNSYFCSLAENLNNSYFCSLAENLNNFYFCSVAENLNNSYFCSVAENLNNSYFCSLAENLNNSYFCSVAENLNNSYFCSVAENLNNSYFCSVAENLNNSYFCSLAENLNNSYFCSLAENLNKRIDKNVQALNNFIKFLPKAEESSIFLEDITVNEISEIICKSSNDKASDIPIVVLKHCKSVLSAILAKIFNNCISNGIFQDPLKVSKITPVCKKGANDDIGNYRPVSVLPIFGKIFEKILYSRIYSFMCSKNIISELQFGFRKYHSTNHAIQHSVSFINDSHLAGKHVLGIFIDLSKAFDTIDHDTLLSKLYHYGIRGNSYKFISSYLTNRYQYVKVNNAASDHLLIKFGVPQGSFLGPLLFLLYINDLKYVSKNKNCKIILYADDTNIFIACETLDKAIESANNVLSHINEYMLFNLLHINLDKSCFMYFPPKRKFLKITRVDKKGISESSKDANTIIEKTNAPIYIGEKAVKEVTEVRFLGVIFDPLLDWSAHIH